MKTNMFVRVAGPVIAISAIPLVVAVAAAWQLNTSYKRVSKQLSLDVAGLRAGEELAIDIRDVRTEINQFLLHGGDEASLLPAIAPKQNDVEHWIAVAERAAATEGEKQHVAQLREACTRFFNQLGEITREKTAPQQRKEKIATLMHDVLEDKLLTPAQNYLDTYAEEDIENSNEKNLQLANRAVLGLLLLGICGPLSGLVAGFGIARGYSRSIVRLSLPIQDAAGKLNEIVGPITFSAQASLEEIEIVLHKIADQIGAVVERLQESRREALRAEQLAAVGQMAAGIAHELRNPLMAMKILVQAAAEANPPALADRDLSVLEEEITRLERSAETFLDFARPPEIERRTFDLRLLVKQVLDLVSPRADRQGVRVSCSAPQNQTIPIRADMGQLRQVLLNLLLNALDAVSEGGAVSVEIETTDTGGNGSPGWVIVRVCDTGRGLPSELGTKIFEPFVSTKPTGIGLGLSICKRIVESHGGQILAVNRPGGGAEFIVRLPGIAAAEPPVKAGTAAPVAAPVRS
ncbi:MAG TPA: ATP-binding protein [Planctomycetaceae bacterium]|nr:ATP-binding protein [Planctomycetaceae bacterium]